MMEGAIVRKRRRSALESFDGCPHRYFVLYNLCQCGHPWSEHTQVGPHFACIGPKVSGPAGIHDPCGCAEFTPVEDRGDESQRGIAFHEAAFRYIARLAEAQLPMDAGEASLAFQEGIALTQLPFHLVDHVKRLWDRFTGWFELDLQAYMAAEERQETERFTWIPDLVYVRPQGVEIKDWKTYYKGLTREQALKEFQLKFYLVHAMKLWPNFPSYTFTFNFVRLAYEVSITLTPDQIAAFEDEVNAIDLALTEAERTSTYPAIPGSHCTLCRLACPLVDNPARLPIRITDAAQAQEAFGRILVLEQELKTLKKSVEGFCLQAGPIRCRGQEYAHRERDTTTFPLRQVLTELGPDSPSIDLIHVSHTALKPVWKSKAQVPATIVPAVKRGWSFRHQKAGEAPKETAGLVDVLADVNGHGGSGEGGDDGGDD